jgi:hypothetical protein
MMHSGDGLHWVDGGEMWVGASGTQAMFASACRTPYGVHLIAATNFPATIHTHLFSKDGITDWKVLEVTCPTLQGTKGTNLAYCSGTNVVYALTSGYLMHFEAKDFSKHL